MEHRDRWRAHPPLPEPREDPGPGSEPRQPRPGRRCRARRSTEPCRRSGLLEDSVPGSATQECKLDSLQIWNAPRWCVIVLINRLRFTHFQIYISVNWMSLVLGIMFPQLYRHSLIDTFQSQPWIIQLICSFMINWKLKSNRLSYLKQIGGSLPLESPLTASNCCCC